MKVHYKRSSLGSSIVEGTAMIGILVLFSLLIIYLIVNVSMVCYFKERLGFVTIQVANYAVSLNPDDPTISNKITSFTNDLFTKMGMKYNGQSINPVQTTVDGQSAMSVEITNSFPLINSSISGPIITLTDSATATAVGRIPTQPILTD